MKRKLIVSLLMINILGKAQETSVEKNLYGLGIGFQDFIALQYETKLTQKITLRSEVGLTYGSSTKNVNQGDVKNQTTNVIATKITLEPRWYYSLDRRNKKGKKTYNNSANFISLKNFYGGYKNPVTQNGDFDIVSAISIIPSYGIRRAFAKHFYYEFSAGVGYQYNIFSRNECDCSHSSLGSDLQVRIGYNF